MKTYRNPVWGFTIALPDGWREPSLLIRLLSFGRYRNQKEQPQFFGPFNSSLKFTIRPINQVPGVIEQQKNLERLADTHGNRVNYLGVIHVNGKDHATMICLTPGVGEMKIYSLIFSNTQYLITAQGRYQETDFIVKSFRP